MKYSVFVDSPVAVYVGPDLTEDLVNEILERGIALFYRTLHFSGANMILRNNIVAAFKEYSTFICLNRTDEFYKINPKDSIVTYPDFHLVLINKGDEVSLKGEIKYFQDYDVAFRKFIGLTLDMFKQLAFENITEDMDVVMPDVISYLDLCDEICADIDSEEYFDD